MRPEPPPAVLGGRLAKRLNVCPAHAIFCHVTWRHVLTLPLWVFRSSAVAGLPGETDEDVLGIAETIEWLQRECRTGRWHLAVRIDFFTLPHGDT